MTSFEIGILIFIAFVCIFAIVNRIVSGIESILNTKYFYEAYTKVASNSSIYKDLTPEMFKNAIEKGIEKVKQS